ncbi:MAG: DUF86 domain-containing protein [Candidatus Aminicenantes bacterium]|nr:MAG: DUF86 domain-containing protein [Candidatus Aminicenantes bacterium]
MSNRDWKILFEDILESIEKIERYTEGLEFDDFSTDSMIIDAVVRNIEIIGEASKNVPIQIKEKLTEVPWTKLAGIRNRIVHEYFGVDINIIWFIVTNELSQLKQWIKDGQDKIGTIEKNEEEEEEANTSNHPEA